MPKLDIDMFDETPKVGDNIKVEGKVESIDKESGEVDVTYGDVSIVEKKKKKTRRDRNNDEDDEIVFEQEMIPNTQTLDQALAQSFPQTQ